MLESMVKELHRQVVKLENWLRRLEDRFQRHLDSADDHPLYLLADGTRPLTGEWDIGEDMSIKGERIEARDVEGLRIEDDGGNLGVFVEDGGQVGVGNAAPGYPLHVGAGADTLVRTETAIAAQVAGTTAITARNTTADVEGTLIAGGGSVAVGAATNHSLLLITNNTTAVTVLADGNMGVGGSPAVRLHLAGATGELLRLDDSSATGTPFLSFCQASTRRSYIGHSDTADNLILASEYGTMSFWTGTGGTEVLRATWGTDGHLTFEDGLRIQIDGVRARDSGGLYLRDDSGTMGIKVTDGGSVIIGDDQTPNTLFEVRGSTGGITLTRTSDVAAAEPFLLFRKGTSPATVCQVRGIDGGGMRFTDGAASVEWARFDANGLLGVGDPSPDGMLDVVQASTTAAIPVVELNQADLSEEFINFITTIGTGNPIEAVGAKTLTTTHFIRIQVNGVGYRYFPVGTIA